MRNQSKYRVWFKTQYWEGNERKIDFRDFYAYNSDHAKDLCLNNYVSLEEDIVDVRWIEC